MSSAIAITVNDGKATPVAHTYTPVQNPGGDGFTFFDAAIGIPAYEWKIWSKLKMGGVNASSSTSVGTIMPVTKLVDGITVQDHVNSAKTEFTFAPNATAAERADLYATQINALNNALIREQARDLKGLY